MRRPRRRGRVFASLAVLQRAIPAAGVDADRADLDAMLARVADELGGGVEAHRLGVEQGRAEDLRMIMLHPGRGVGDLGEARGVAFGKAVAAEALDLLEGALGEIAAHSRCAIMPLIILSRKWLTPPVDLERRHRAAQRIGLGRREAGADDRDLHRLLLEERHAQRLLQHLLQLLRWDIPPSPCPRAGADRDGPYCPGSGPGRTIATWMTMS